MAVERAIGVDVGGTKILGGVVGRDGSVGDRLELPTPTGSQDGLLAALDEVVAELLSDEIASIGFGVPSQIDYRTGRVLGSVNIPLAGVDLAAQMSERFGRAAAIDNDANAAALGEYSAGAGKSARAMVMLTLGTGCGGGVVVDGEPLRAWAEFGHIVVEFDGIPCQGACTGRGHLEPYVTGVAATKLAREAFGPEADSHRLIELGDDGDATAAEILRGIGRRLGAGISTLVNIFNPDLVVLGGGFGTAAARYLVGPAEEVMRRDALPSGPEPVRLVPAELGTAAGLIGAGMLAFGAVR
jgi:glucokinase